VKQLLEEIGLEQERIKMYNLSAAMANKFVNIAKEMTEEITSLGPNLLRNNPLAANNDSKEREA
jgi:coenzyme F420-reducing hydrogenase delta subunit